MMLDYIGEEVEREARHDENEWRKNSVKRRNETRRHDANERRKREFGEEVE